MIFYAIKGTEGYIRLKENSGYNFVKLDKATVFKDLEEAKLALHKLKIEGIEVNIAKLEITETIIAEKSTH